MKYEVEYTAPVPDTRIRVHKVETVEADSPADARSQFKGQGRVVLSTTPVPGGAP